MSQLNPSTSRPANPSEPSNGARAAASASTRAASSSAKGVDGAQMAMRFMAGNLTLPPALRKRRSRFSTAQRRQVAVIVVELCGFGA